jgi:hypothetical protein
LIKRWQQIMHRTAHRAGYVRAGMPPRELADTKCRAPLRAPSSAQASASLLDLSNFSGGLALSGADLQTKRSLMFPCERTASMARQVTLNLVDDIDGSPAAETVSFGLDGRLYDIDLSAAHATQLRDALAAYVAAARRGTSSTRRRRSPAPSRPAEDREQTAAIRQWARANGQRVSDRGRISRSVLEAYGNRDQVSVPAETAAPAKKSRKRSKKAAG